MPDGLDGVLHIPKLLASGGSSELHTRNLCCSYPGRRLIKQPYWYGLSQYPSIHLEPTRNVDSQYCVVSHSTFPFTTTKSWERHKTSATIVDNNSLVALWTSGTVSVACLALMLLIVVMVLFLGLVQSLQEVAIAIHNGGVG